MNLKALPNLLTGLRIVLGVAVFFALATAAGVLGFGPDAATRSTLALASFVAFVIGAVTDYFDGYLARRLQAQSPWGVILDPIADKIAVGAAILGLALLEPRLSVAVPGFLILFREFFVSGLREAIAPRGLKLPVTQLAKWKTTLQLVGLAAQMLAAAWPERAWVGWTADTLLWAAALITLWTGAQYAAAAGKALKDG